MYLFWAFSVLVLLYIYYNRVQKYKELNSLPGPAGLPILGNLFQLGKNPCEVLSNLESYRKQFGNIYKLWIGPLTPVVVISDVKAIETILSSTINIKKSTAYKILHSLLGEGLLTGDGETWRRRRKLLTPAFHFKILERFMHVFHVLGNRLIEKLGENIGENGFNVYPYIERYTLDVICETSMGLQLDTQNNPNHKYLRSITDLQKGFTMRQFSLIGRIEKIYKYTPAYSDWWRCINEIKTFTNDVIENKCKQRAARKSNNKDVTEKKPFLDLLLTIEEEGNITMEGLRNELETFMLAGYDATATTISFCLFELAKHRNVQEKIFEEIKEVIEENGNDILTISHLSSLKYLESCLKETMRMYTTIPLVERCITHQLELDGKVIPKGTTVTLFLHGLHNSKENHTDPEKFDPRRFSSENSATANPFSHVPFSAGSRNCMGQKFAMLELKATIAQIIKNFILLPVKPEHRLQLGTAMTLKSFNGVPIRIEKRI